MFDQSKLPNIAVNATALDSSGGLTILKQFIKHAGEDIAHRYICFIPEGLNFEKKSNLTFVEIPKMGWLQRILWDSYKFRAYLTKHDVKPMKVISLQNTSVNVSTEQIIYLHQPLPFSDIKWSIFKKEQFKFFLYKYFYKFFILLFINKQTIFVVQTNWMKDALCEQCNVARDKVHIIKPDIKFPDVAVKSKEEIGIQTFPTLLFPATPLYYKNHQVILDALKLMKENNQIGNIKFQVTFKSEEYPSFSDKVNKMGLTDNVEYLGTMPYNQLIERYQAASIVLFPSFIETFGLPLAEGATLNKPILCSDLLFSRDVLNGYPGAIYLDYKDPIAWAEAISDTLNKIKDDSWKCHEYIFEQSSSWKDFFKLLQKS
jgi:glycosyltransferase involved in cell wall biosynthesis